MSREQALRTYFQAKDENRPHLLDDVFATDARLEIRNRFGQISFPARTAWPEKESKAVRAGCGRYEWAFQSEPGSSVTELIITIEVMLVRDAAMTGEMMRLVGKLDYPWSSAAAMTCMLCIRELQPVRNYLERQIRAKYESPGPWIRCLQTVASKSLIGPVSFAESTRPLVAID